MPMVIRSGWGPNPQVPPEGPRTREARNAGLERHVSSQRRREFFGRARPARLPGQVRECAWPQLSRARDARRAAARDNRSEEHTSELQSQSNLVCRLLLEKKKKKKTKIYNNKINITN